LKGGLHLWGIVKHSNKKAMQSAAINFLSQFNPGTVLNWQGSINSNGGAAKEENTGIVQRYADTKSGTFLADSPLMLIGENWCVGMAWVGSCATIGELIGKIQSLPPDVVKPISELI
jgi:hypothetical protein